MSDTANEHDGGRRTVRITDLKADDRPREKALAHGIKALSDAELIAIQLGMGLPGLSALDMSRMMLEQSGNSLVRIAAMPLREMTRRFKGVGEAKAVSVAAAFELGSRMRAELDRTGRHKPGNIRSSSDIYAYIRSDLEMLPYEEFWAIFLTRANVVIDKRLISRGGTASTVVDVKLIMREAVNHLASGIILVHNHPSGNLQPSAQDDSLTRRVAEAACLLDCAVLDHIIISSTGYYSYNDNGRLKKP